MIEAIVFDMDGLLFDSERIVQRSWEEAGNQLGLEHMGETIYHTLGMNLAGRNHYFRNTIAKDFPCEEFAKQARIWFYKIVNEEGLPMKNGARELLEYGKANGYRMAIATSSRREYALKNLKAAKIYDFFDAGVFGDMVQHAKPDPEIYLKACDSIGAAPANCIALEDAPAGIRAAYAAGMKPIMIPDLVAPTPEIEALLYETCDTLLGVIGIMEKLKK
ncbi:MAG: HAD family phosphatase [Lachnospiraceae bacterium]|nr:HAD family phosphatase [Lachnospiraceae bacterium]MDY4207439.1 HAD family phosphatase [Lachnospiraceae bacterium]